MFCFLDSESCVLLPESLLNVVDDPGGKGAALLRPYFRMRAGGVGSGAGAPAPAARSAESCWGAASCARTALSGSAASLQSCTAGEAGLSSSGRGMPRPYSAQRQRGIATILHRRRSGSLRGGARHRAPVQCSAAARHRCNPAPQAKRASPRRGAACRSRPLLCRSGASLQSCTAATTRRSRPSRAQRGVVLHVLWSFR